MGENSDKDEKPPKERRRRWRGGKKFRPATPGSKYKAPTSGLEGYIYESGAAKHAAQFTETTEKLCNYMQSNYKSGADVAAALRQLRELTITMPDARPDPPTPPEI